MLSYLLPYTAGLTVLIIGDLLWLGFLMRGFYVQHLGHLMAPTVNWYAAVAFYLIYVAGVLAFAVLPQASKGLMAIALTSLALGAFAYAVYDLTNHATLRDWPLAVTLVDIAWGAFLTALVGTVMGYVLLRNPIG